MLIFKKINKSPYYLVNDDNMFNYTIIQIKIVMNNYYK